MRLRCRHAKGVDTFGAGLDSTSSLADLKASLAAVTGIPVMTQSIKFGFPPKLVTGADTDTISACGIKDGEQLIVDRNTTLGASVELTKPHTVPASKSIPATSIPVNGGILVVREMKDDNSCLFRSIGYLLENNPEISSKLRNVVSSKILADPIHYNAAILGKDPSVYASWILKPNSWGGGIELAILSEHYKVEIDLIDVATTRMSRLGENQYESRIFVMYTGIHYDAISWTPAENAPHDFEQRLFKNQEADDIARGAIKLAEIWKTQRKFTNMVDFTLKCGICLLPLVGEKDARAHASSTGHTSFSEY